MYHRTVVEAGTFSKLNKSSTAIGLRWGTSTKALASHQCGPGSIQSPIRRLMWVEFIGALCYYEWFSSGFSGFPLFPSSPSQWSLKKVWSSGIFFSGAEYQGSRFWRFVQGTLSPGINFKLPVDFSTISAWRICHSKRLLILLKEISWISCPSKLSEDIWFAILPLLLTSVVIVIGAEEKSLFIAILGYSIL